MVTSFLQFANYTDISLLTQTLLEFLPLMPMFSLFHLLMGDLVTGSTQSITQAINLLSLCPHPFDDNLGVMCSEVRPLDGESELMYFIQQLFYRLFSLP